jgi:hypothetical protein
MAAFYIQRLVHHDVELFDGRNFFSVYGDGFGAFLEFHEGVFLDGAVQFDYAHADESAAFLARAETEGGKQSI